jgi:predicted Zn-dependent protease
MKPDDPDYRYIIGTIYLRQGDHAKAIEYLKPIAEDMVWHQGTQYNLGQALIRAGQQDEAQYYLARADSAQQLQQAVNEARNAVNADAQNRDLWVDYSQLLWKKGDQDEAIQAYQVALSIDPYNFAMQNNFANMLIQSGRKDEGIRRLQSIIRVRPEIADTWLNLGAAYANDGLHDEARATWEEGRNQNPDDPRFASFLRQLAELE